jgi:osmotically-inducible protein OsmY
VLRCTESARAEASWLPPQSREAEVDARHIEVEVSDHTVKLYGHVHSLKEANAATAAAAAAPGIAKVESHLVVSP